MTIPTPYPLGRHVEHDPRSRGFAYLPPAKLTLTRSLTWPRRAPILDQGQLGSCTGNAMAGWLGTDPHGTSKGIDEPLAVSLYSDATRLDPYPGAYPPEDTGSSGLAVCKAAQNRGLLTSYRHAFDFAATLDALTHGPIIVGVPWYESMFTPQASGYLTISGSVVGGHEFLIRGIDPRKKHVLADNSWGYDWGRKGRFWLHWADLERLLSEDGDATVPQR